MRLRRLAAALAVLVFSLAARAETFSYSLDAGGSGFSNTGTLTGDPYGRGGGLLLTAFTGSGVTGLICTPFSGFPPRPCAGSNDNLVYPNGIGNNGDPNQLLDTFGILYAQQIGMAAYEVNLYRSGTAYFARITDAGNSSRNIPVQFSLAATTVATTPEPSSLVLLTTGVLGLIGVARRRFA